MKESYGFGGSQPEAGRPRTKRPIEALNEAVDLHANELVSALVDTALNARKAVVNHKHGILEHEPDFAARHRATELLLAYRAGRPVARTELTGGLTIMDLLGESE